MSRVPYVGTLKIDGWHPCPALDALCREWDRLYEEEHGRPPPTLGELLRAEPDEGVQTELPL